MSRIGPSRGFVTVIAALALAVAGCGSSKSSTPSITKAQFLAKGNAICVTSNGSRNRVQAALGNKPSRAQFVNYVKQSFIPSIQSTIDQLRALGSPPGDQAKVKGLFDTAQADLNKLKAKPTLILGGPSLFHNFAGPAHAYGLTQCARNA